MIEYHGELLCWECYLSPKQYELRFGKSNKIYSGKINISGHQFPLITNRTP